MYALLIIAILIVAVISIYLFSNSTTGYIISNHRNNILGPEDAKITIIEFSDFQCPFCGRVQPTIKQILQDYGDQVKLIYKHFPLDFHQYSRKAAEAAECAGQHGKFWEYHDKLFENQDKLLINDLKRYAEEIGIDVEGFSLCLDSGAAARVVNDDMSEGLNMGVSGTPAFFINGKKIEGAQPYSVFKTIIEAELKS